MMQRRAPFLREQELPTLLSAGAATAVLTIDLGAIARNWRRLRDLAAPAECAAVVKADAYGTGLAPVVSALLGAGCRTFFVATLGEGVSVRDLAQTADIYVLNGFFPGCAPEFCAANLRPVLGSTDELVEWASFRPAGLKPPAALHLDTGINRLGMSASALDKSDVRDLLRGVDLSLVMSHLACADEPGNPKNAAQRCVFNTARGKLPNVHASLVNSAGILLGSAYHFDLVRPGIALYGGGACPESSCEPVVRLDARIVQIRDAKPGDTVGYGAKQTLSRPSRIAIVAIGYADGYFRALGSSDQKPGASAYHGDKPLPLLGRVSMDLLAVDVTELPEGSLKRGDFIELIGPHVGIDDLASLAGTLGYEVLTALGQRSLRRYTGG